MSSNEQSETWESSPSGMMEYYQHQKYQLGQSIADLVDNSYDHGATKIDIKLDQLDGELYLRILDDGFGMDNNELTKAMGLGVRTKGRSHLDLGIFGIGMKLSSLAQANQVTVCSLKNNQYTVRRIDADFIRDKDENTLMKTPTNSEIYSDSYKEFIDKNWKTMVLLEDLHGKKRFHSYDRDFEDSITKEILKIRIHLGLTFQKIIRDKPEITLSFNGKKIEPIDPMMYHEKDENFGTESWQKHIEIDVEGSTVMTKVIFAIIPHSTCCSDNKSYKKVNKGYLKANDMQGLYIYRNNRLIDYGGWHGLVGTNDEHSKLAKIEIHVSPSHNKFFGLNPTKTDLSLPVEFMRKLHERSEEQRTWGAIGSTKLSFTKAADHRYRNDGKKKKKLQGKPKSPKSPQIPPLPTDPKNPIVVNPPQAVPPIPKRTPVIKPQAVVSEIRDNDPHQTIIILDKSKEGYENLMRILRNWKWD